MITGDDILSYNFYTYGQPFSGSYQGMRYRAVKTEREKEDGETETVLEACVWPEPFAYEETADRYKTVQDFEMSEDGRLKMLDWLNRQYEEHEWKPGFTASMLKNLKAEK